MRSRLSCNTSFFVIFLATGVLSFVRRSPSIALFDDVRAGPTVNVVAPSWQNFETLVEGLWHHGFEVTMMSRSVSIVPTSVNVDTNGSYGITRRYIKHEYMRLRSRICVIDTAL
jgi:hypothetical protein